MTAYDRIAVRPISGALGAEIDGVDLACDLKPAVVAEIRRALLEHLVICFRDQAITPDHQIAFARRFGALADYPYVKGLDSHPEIVEVAKLEHETVNFGGIWHSDTAYLEKPPMGTMLYALELPPTGGDTLFANMYLAYETLSDGMKRLLDGLVAVNRSDKAAVSATREDRMRDSPKGAQPLVAEHPVVRRHPETGRRALYINVAHSARFKGMTEVESAPILEYLFRHQVRPEFTCRLRWGEGTLAFWDNRCTQHFPVNDYHGHRRVMHRVTIAGEVPVGG